MTSFSLEEIDENMEFRELKHYRTNYV